jgi:hypothetical protein
MYEEDTKMADQSNVVGNTIKALGEAFVLPGSSQFLDGNVASGVLHALGGVVARSLLGPIGWVAVGLNSYASSVTGQPLHRHLGLAKSDK